MRRRREFLGDWLVGGSAVVDCVMDESEDEGMDD